jgi:hypothetical protein
LSQRFGSNTRGSERKPSARSSISIYLSSTIYNAPAVVNKQAETWNEAPSTGSLNTWKDTIVANGWKALGIGDDERERKMEIFKSHQASSDHDWVKRDTHG